MRGVALSPKLKWSAMCGMLVFPLAAAFHHLVFHPYTCMLNNFGAIDYTDLAGVIRWLKGDPSLPLAIVCATLLFYAQRFWPKVKTHVASILPSFLLFSIYIWDIPFSNRVICRTFHDNREVWGLTFRTTYFYLFGIVSYFTLLYVKRSVPSSENKVVGRDN
jgi:hypothetical protein